MKCLKFFILLIFFNLISCGSDSMVRDSISEKSIEDLSPKESFKTKKKEYNIVSYSFETPNDTLMPFSNMALTQSHDYLIKTRMAYLNYRFNWNLGDKLDSAFVFGIMDSSMGKSGLINFEIWNKLDKNDIFKVKDSLDILFNNTVYYKPPCDWHWFVYKDKFFFMDCYRLGNREFLYQTKNKYINDTVFLEYILNQLQDK